MEREPRETRTIIDLTVPLSKEKRQSMVKKGNCFGQELDFDTRECQMCADNELCSLLFKDKVDSKVKEYEETHEPTLDKADLSLVDKESLYKNIKKQSGKMTTEELAQRVIDESHLTDQVAIVEFIKRFKDEKGFKIKGGVVYAE